MAQPSLLSVRSSHGFQSHGKPKPLCFSAHPLGGWAAPTLHIHSHIWEAFVPSDDADTTNIQRATPYPEPFLCNTTIKSSPFHYEGGALTVAVLQISKLRL